MVNGQGASGRPILNVNRKMVLRYAPMREAEQFAIQEGIKKGNGVQQRQDIDQTLVIEQGDVARQQQGAEQVFTVQQMARATGISAHTLRYYERAGLMQPAGRNDANGHRAYTSRHIGWIQFIKRLRATGMPIRDIQRYTRLILEGEQTVPDRMELLQQHQARVEAHLAEVSQHLAAITAKIAYYEQQAGQQQAQAIPCDGSLAQPCAPQCEG